MTTERHHDLFKKQVQLTVSSYSTTKATSKVISENRTVFSPSKTEQLNVYKEQNGYLLVTITLCDKHCNFTTTQAGNCKLMCIDSPLNPLWKET